MKNSAASSWHRATPNVECPSPNDTANEELSASGKEAPQCSPMHRSRAESPTLAAIKLNPESRLNAAQQLQIVDMFLAGYGYSAIARQLHRNRRTVTRICRSRDVQAMIQKQREKLIAESDSWMESIAFAVETELDGRLGYKLCEAFGIIPSLSKKAAPAKPQDNWQSIDPYQLAMARELGLIAMERASSRPPEAVEKLAQKDPIRSNPKRRLFDCRDT